MEFLVRVFEYLDENLGFLEVSLGVFKLVDRVGFVFGRYIIRDLCFMVRILRVVWIIGRRFV